MHSSIAQKQTAASGGKGRVSNASMVRKEFRTGYELPEPLSYQKFGIQGRMLWPSRNQILRIIPGYDQETGEVFKQNINGEGGWDDSVDMGEYLPDTFTIVSALSGFGLSTSPIITDYAPGSEDAEKWGGSTVLDTFCRTIKNSVASAAGTLKWKIRGYNPRPGRNWALWCSFNPEKGTPVIDLPRPTLLMQALVFKLNDRNNMTTLPDTGEQVELTDSNGDIAPLLYVIGLQHKTSVEALETALVKPHNRNLPLDAATNNEYGPMAETVGYKLFLNTCTDPKTGHPMLRPSVQAGSKGWTPTQYDLTDEIVRQLWHPWDQLLNYMTAQEQIEMCAAYFGADTVNYVLGKNPELRDLQIPDSIKAVGLGQYAGIDGSADGPRQDLSGVAKPRMSGFAGLSAKPAAKKEPDQQHKPLSGVTASSGVDMDKLRENVAKIRAASSGLASLKGMTPVKDQADEAADLLGGEDELTPFG